MNGWILLHRKLLESLVFKNEKCLKVWMWCLLKANHQENTFLLGRKKMVLKKGQFVTGGLKAEEFLNIARTTIYYWLDFLVAEGMIDIKKTNKYTIITIRNWAKYQTLDNKRTSNVTTNGQQKDTNNNDNNDKETIATKVAGVPFNSNDFIDKCCKDKQEHIRLIGNYMKIKKMNFPTKKTADAELRRNLKIATLLKDYPPERRKRALMEANKMTRQWTLETVLKYLNK